MTVEAQSFQHNQATNRVKLSVLFFKRMRWSSTRGSRKLCEAGSCPAAALPAVNPAPDDWLCQHAVPRPIEKMNGFYIALALGAAVCQRSPNFQGVHRH